MEEQETKKCRLLITSLAPNLGGVGSMMTAFQQAVNLPNIRTGYAYNLISDTDPTNVTLKSLSHGKWFPTFEHSVEKQIDVYKIGAYFPRLESQRFWTNAKVWAQVLNQYDVHQVISGYALDAIPVAKTGKRFALWLATDLESERRAHLKSHSLLKQLVVRAQMPLLRKMENYVLKRASWVFAISPSTLERAIQRGADPKRSSLLVHPVNKVEPGLQKNKDFTIIWSGRLSDPRKNTSLLVNAFSKLSKEFPKIKLTLIGADPQGTVKKMVESLGVSGKVEFCGEITREEALKKMSAGQVFVVPSLQEGLCIAGLEAMAAGLPVISTRCGGTDCYVFHEKTGYFVEDEAQLVAILKKLILDKQLCDTIGKNAQELVYRNFSFEFFRETILKIYSLVWPEYDWDKS